MREDLPTLERPIKANSGNGSLGADFRLGALVSNSADLIFIETSTTEDRRKAKRSRTYQVRMKKPARESGFCSRRDVRCIRGASRKERHCGPEYIGRTAAKRLRKRNRKGERKEERDGR
jgi:hypothetical protein